MGLKTAICPVFFDIWHIIRHKEAMSAGTINIQDKILNEALKDIPFDGLKWDVILRAADKVGYDSDVALSVFPAKVSDFLKHFSAWADTQMLEKLQSLNPDEMKIRQRVREAVWIRLQILTPHREVVKLSMSYWINPMNKPTAAKIVWQTSDVIWKWAGDTATDYNKYTKRGLLSGVITATTLAWLNDKSHDFSKTATFLDRRIDNVLALGKLTGKIMGKVKPAKGAT
jgi:ubiquinone biosynthesis protein COQ9